MEILNNFASIYCFITFVLGAMFMLAMIIIAAMGKVEEPTNKIRFFVTQEYGVHCLKLWMGKPELNEKMRWVSRSDTVHFLCDDFYNGNRNLFEDYNLNPNDFADMKEGEIREVFLNLEELSMTREEFKKQIEYPLNHFITNEDVHFWERNHIKATIGRTLRLALQYPNLAQEYLDSLPKATMD